MGISKANASNPVLFEEGIVDADADSLDDEFEALASVWNERERMFTNCSDPEVVRKCMLKASKSRPV